MFSDASYIAIQSQQRHQQQTQQHQLRSEAVGPYSPSQSLPSSTTLWNRLVMIALCILLMTTRFLRYAVHSSE